VQTYLAFFFPPATAGVSGNLYFHCQSDKTGNIYIYINCKEDPGMIKVKHVIHLAHIVVKKCDTWFLGFFLPCLWPYFISVLYMLHMCSCEQVLDICFSSKLAYFIILLYILCIVVNECSDMFLLKVPIIFDYLVIHLAHGCVQQQGRFNF
jgi:hypothetical protein